VAKRKRPIPQKHNTRCSATGFRDNVRHFYHVGWMHAEQAVAASMNVLKKACGCSVRQKRKRMTVKNILTRCGR